MLNKLLHKLTREIAGLNVLFIVGIENLVKPSEACYNGRVCNGPCVREKCPLALAPVSRGEKSPGYKTLEKGKDRL